MCGQKLAFKAGGMWKCCLIVIFLCARFLPGMCVSSSVQRDPLSGRASSRNPVKQHRLFLHPLWNEHLHAQPWNKGMDAYHHYDILYVVCLEHHSLFRNSDLALLFITITVALLYQQALLCRPYDLAAMTTVFPGRPWRTEPPFTSTHTVTLKGGSQTSYSMFKDKRVKNAKGSARKLHVALVWVPPTLHDWASSCVITGSSSG